MVEFNDDKTVFMIFSLERFKSNVSLIFQNKSITRVEEHKHLGLIFSDDMKWSKHANYICKKAHKKIGLLYRNSMYLNVHQMSHYYKTSIRLIVEYASVVFDGLSLTDCVKLENVQRRAARVCTGGHEKN